MFIMGVLGLFWTMIISAIKGQKDSAYAWIELTPADRDERVAMKPVGDQQAWSHHLQDVGQKNILPVTYLLPRVRCFFMRTDEFL